MVNCSKTTKNGDECRSLYRFNTSAARDIRLGKAIRNSLNGHATRNHSAGPFLNVPSAPPRRAVLLWLTVLKPPKAGASAGRSHDPLLAPHGTYVRIKTVQTLLNGHVTRNHRAGSF